jgi:RimJ/RimL family protein N-acetyltransferase
MSAPIDYPNQQSERFLLRRLKQSDIEPWVEFFSDNPNLAYLAIRTNAQQDGHSDLEWSKKWMQKQFDRYRTTGFGLLAIISKQTGEIVGQAGISEKTINGKLEHEVAYSLLPRFWKQGIAHEVSQVLIEFAIKHKINQRLISIIHIENEGSIKVAEKNGMTVQSESEYLGMKVYIFGRLI